MEEASSGREVKLEGMATFWRNLNLLPQLKTEVSVKLLVRILHLRPPLKDLRVPPYNSEHLLKWI